MRPRPFRVVLPLIVAVAAPAWADEPLPVRIEIVGSRVPRIAAETALPVTVIRRAEIERSGVDSVEQLLALVSANFGGHDEAMGLGDDDTLGFSGASLRGFGAAETLVLLNGRRLANYAFTSTTGPGVDLHAIPLAAIERVEVLKDGASALYGSDAIAGVINFVTRKDFHGGEFSLARSEPQAGGGARTRATASAGGGNFDDDGYNVFVVLDVQRGERLRATQRDFASTSYRPEIGLNGLSPSSWPANIRRLPAPLLNPAAPGCTADTVLVRNACWFDVARTLELIAPSTQLNVFSRGVLRLGVDAEAYAELSIGQTRVRYAASPTPASPSTTLSNTAFVLPATSAYYPDGLGLSGDLSLAYRTLPLGPRTSEVESNNARVLAGVRWFVAGWDLDAALAHNDSRSREMYLNGMVDAGRLSRAIASGLVNPFGESGTAGDALLQASQLYGTSRQARGLAQGADIQGTRDIASLRGGPLSVAAGAELRHESLRDEHMAIVEDVVGGGFSGAKEGRRSVQAAYAELVAPLLRGLELQAAARWDHYSDFGSTVNPKLALRWQPQPAWLLRASVGRGFRAPSLPELYTGNTQSQGRLGELEPPVTDPVRCPVTGLPADCAPVVTITSGGNAALQPQRSTQSGAGIVFEPARSWQLSVDVWAIRIHDIIGSLNPDDVAEGLVRYDGRNVQRGPVDPAFPDLPGPLVGIDVRNQNLGEWRVDGSDLSLSLSPTATALGRISARLDGTYVRRARQNISEGNQVDLIGRIAPRWQQVLTLTLDRGGWSATLSHRYRRGYLDKTLLDDGRTHRVASFRMLDAQLAFDLTPALRLSLSVHNLLDADPPATNQTDQFQVGYDPLYADPLGRTWRVALRARWP